MLSVKLKLTCLCCCYVFSYISALNNYKLEYTIKMQQCFAHSRKPSKIFLQQQYKIIFFNSALKINTDSGLSITKTCINKNSDLLKKSCMVGGYITVPQNKAWQIKRVFVTQGIAGNYNVLIKYNNTGITYTPGQKIYAPTWSAESTLLTNDASDVSYIFEIEETVINIDK